jgi:hypothetical protein
VDHRKTTWVISRAGKLTVFRRSELARCFGSSAYGAENMNRSERWNDGNLQSWASAVRPCSSQPQAPNPTDLHSINISEIALKCAQGKTNSNDFCFAFQAVDLRLTDRPEAKIWANGGLENGQRKCVWVWKHD